MKTIYRYPINNCDGVNRIKMPNNAKVISAGVANDEISIWAEIDTLDPPTEERLFVVVGTGGCAEFMEADIPHRFIGTVCKANHYAFHIYEILETARHQKVEPL